MICPLQASRRIEPEHVQGVYRINLFSTVAFNLMYPSKNKKTPGLCFSGFSLVFYDGSSYPRALQINGLHKPSPTELFHLLLLLQLSDIFKIRISERKKENFFLYLLCGGFKDKEITCRLNFTTYPNSQRILHKKMLELL